MAGFDSVYVAACPEVDWAADLPDGAFSKYDSRGAVISKGEDRAITLKQLRSFATLIKQVLGIRTMVDDNKYSDPRRTDHMADDQHVSYATLDDVLC